MNQTRRELASRSTGYFCAAVHPIPADTLAFDRLFPGARASTRVVWRCSRDATSLGCLLYCFLFWVHRDLLSLGADCLYIPIETKTMTTMPTFRWSIPPLVLYIRYRFSREQPAAARVIFVRSHSTP